MLGGEIDSGTVTHFVFDKSANRSSATYSPDHRVVNKVLKQNWNPSDVRLLGFVHSHPLGNRKPSHGDEIYAERILDHNEEQEFLWLPIVMSEADNGKFELLPFVAERAEDGVSIMSANLEIVDQVDTEPERYPDYLSESQRSLRFTTPCSMPGHHRWCRWSSIIHRRTG